MANYYSFARHRTAKFDKFLCLERKDRMGYCWYKEWAGAFRITHTENIPVIKDGRCCYVREDIIEELWTPILIENQVRYVIFNNPETLSLLTINRKELTANLSQPGPFLIITPALIETEIQKLEQLKNLFNKS